MARPYIYNEGTSSVPVCALTDLAGNLITETDLKAGSWYITAAEVMLTRFWSSSDAEVVLSCTQVQNSTSMPQLPPIIGIGQKSTNSSGTAFSGGLEAEFCIWMGYLDRNRPLTKEDLGVRLRRVFIGVLENIVVTFSGSGGLTAHLEFRDRMKWLMDSELYFNPVDLINAQSAAINRSDMILDIANRAIGFSAESGCIGCGKKINRGFVIDIGGGANLTDAPADYWYQSGKPLAGNASGLHLQVSENPTFNIHTTRVPLGSVESGQENFLLSGQIPIEAIKTLAFQEVFPTELFQNHQDGNFYYAPRGNDSSGLEDPERLYRTYTCNVKVDNPAKALIAFKTEFSSLALKTNFIISKNSLGSDSYGEDVMLHLRATPYRLRGKNFACKFTTVVDPTIRPGNVAEMALVALSMARIWAREEQVGMAVLLGDPSLVPGEVVQVIGSPLLEEGGLPVMLSDREKYLNYNRAWNEEIQFFARAAQSGNLGETTSGGTSITGGKLHDGSEFNINPVLGNASDGAKKKDGANAIFCDQSSKVEYNEPPQTIYRIEAVKHKFNRGTKGFLTELALVSPF